jgi:uncharacterized membrane protein YGL010W
MSFTEFKKSHLATFLFLAPFVVLLWVHNTLGLNHAGFLIRDQKEPYSLAFDLWMGAALIVGLSGFVIHAACIAHPNKAWLRAKLGFLAIVWIAIWFRS